MSGFGGGGFGGFGSNNQQQQQQGSGFGTGTGFGSGTGGTGFGTTATTQSTPMFGGQNKGGFGTGTTGGGLFGSGTGTGGTFGGAGAGSGSGFGTGGGTGGGFGTGTTGTGGAFGASQPSGGFGSGGQGNSLFGGGTTGATGGTGFGGTTTGTGFGASGTALGAAVPATEGTANPPFNAFTDKDPGSAVSNHYQSVSCMEPYQKYSFEELRAADYNHGRRYGNASGQPGAFGSSAFGGGFGQSTTGGGFGSGTTSSPFGGATSAPSGFGQTQTTSAFGNTSTPNPLFGGTKPATSLFGQTSGASQPTGFGATSAPSGFGSGTSTAFGGGTGATGGGMFGQQQQNKPAFGSGTGSAFGGGFGQQAATTSASPFGGTTAASSPFGGQQQQGGTGGFGSLGQNQQTQNKPLFGGGFGGAQQQPQQPTTGLFAGAGAAGSSPFGGAGAQQQTGTSSLFGNTGAQQTGQTGGLFGSTQQNQQQDQKQGLFGGGFGTGASTTGTGGFGLGTSQNQPQTTSLFGNTQQQQQKPGGLFGSSTGQAGGSLFNPPAGTGATTGGSMFNLGGASQNTQQQLGGGLGSSLLGAPQQASQQQAQPSQFQASLLEGNPYGSQSIFSGLPAPNTPSPGPLATPLSASMKQKQRTPLPVYKVSPNAANRLITPPTRQGYGFSYSTYGTPSSGSNTPGSLNSSLLGGSLRSGSLGRSFSKSLPASGLRKSFDPEADSILSPGAFSPGSSRYSTSNLKRLNIDRSLRTDLFSKASPAPITNGEAVTPQAGSKLKKRVSFESPEDTNAKTDGALVRVETNTPEPTPEELGFLRSSRQQKDAVNGTAVDGVNGVPKDKVTAPQPEMEQVRGKELAVVPEGQEEASQSEDQSPLAAVPAKDPKPGDYWMKPSRAEISKMAREQQKQVSGFTVGRANCGSVTFDRPVDLTSINLDEVPETLVHIRVRSITVYPDEARKPPRGQGLNVPSTLRVENSWPRGRNKKGPPSPLTSGPTFDKHLDRLMKVTNTEFVEYQKQTGVWIFKVPHFTTYGLDYEDDDDYEDEEGESFDQSTMSAPPEALTPRAQTPTQSSFAHNLGSSINSTISVDESSFDESMMEDDTFEFKKRGLIPGSFTNQGVPQASGALNTDSEQDSFLEEGSVGSASEHEQAENTITESSLASEIESDRDEEMDMAGAFPVPDYTAERSIMISPERSTPRPQTRFNGDLPDLNLNLSGNWADQLQRTISPRKQDRQALREAQDDAFADADEKDTPKAKSVMETGFATSIDLMNSLFGQPQGSPRAKKQSVRKGPNAIEWPYLKKPKTFAGSPSEMSEMDVNFHHSVKPRWGPSDTLILPGLSSEDTDLDEESAAWPIIQFQKLTEIREFQDNLKLQRARSTIKPVDGIPFSRLSKTDFVAFAESISGDSDEADLERAVWQLGNILFNDDIEDDISNGVPENLREQYLYRIKKDRVSRLWEGMVRRTFTGIEKIELPEERAVAYLCSHRVEEACRTLIESGNPHLGTLISQIGRDATLRRDIQQQIESWRKHNVYSEMSEPIRALYELLAGNALRSEGKPGAAVEDRTSTFNLSDRFGLDWVQAFGLRLWYGIGDEDSIEEAVSLFHRDISRGHEPAQPVTWFEDDTEDDQANPNPPSPESPLWVMLKVFTSAMSAGKHPDIRPVLMPEAIMPTAVTGNPLHNRLSFQLFHHLSTAAGPYDGIAVDQYRVDQLTLDYAWELASNEQYPFALFVLLHLSRAIDRERSIKDILARYAEWLPGPTTSEGGISVAWKFLTQDLQIPSSWLWAAKALFARADGDYSGEVESLLNAKHWNEAHDTFCRVVAPKMVVKRDYYTIESLIVAFGEHPEKKIRGWANGGALYGDFLSLVTASGIHKDQTKLKRLVTALVGLGEKVERSTTATLEERVAFRDISWLAAEWCARDVGSHAIEPAEILNLPLTQDARLVHAAEVSRKYYSAIMAGGS